MYLVTFQGQEQQKFTSAVKAVKACENFFQCQTKEGLTEIKKSLRSIGWKRVHHCMTDNVICFIEKI